MVGSDDELTAAARNRGVLYPARLPTFTRLDPPDSVADLVRWFWIPEWDLAPGRRSRQQLIAFPACNLVVETDRVGLSGPATTATHRDLEGRGWAVGALLRPAAVPAFVGDPTAWRDRYEVLDEPALFQAVAAAMGAGDTRHAEAVGAFADWLVERVGPISDEAGRANALATLIDTDPTVLRVEDAAARLGESMRSVQRLCRRYVGLTAVTMIRRRRLQEAAERLRIEPTSNLADLAADLGYADQAHLTRDFRAVLGFTPGSYRGTVQKG